MNLKILKYDEADVDAMTAAGTYETYLETVENFSSVHFKEGPPGNGWAVPYVTGHRYRVHWGEGLDFTKMKMEVSERW